MIGPLRSTPKVCGGGLGLIDGVQTMNGPFVTPVSIPGFPQMVILPDCQLFLYAFPRAVIGSKVC